MEITNKKKVLARSCKDWFHAYVRKHIVQFGKRQN